jgi:hypothetical protein
MLQAEIISRNYPDGKESKFDLDSWEKKIIKVYKAMAMMERYKSEEPFYSWSFSSLVSCIRGKRDQARQG